MDTMNNYCVIMAGGIGSRFWPFSRNNRPKQFLDFFGTGKSLLQMTVDRFRPLVPIENVLIVTNVAYRDMILEQIPDLQKEQVLCEPARRNTAPCIAYAVMHIKGLLCRQYGLDIRTADFEKDSRLQANIVVAPSDHLIVQEQRFVDTIRHGLDFVAEHDTLLTLGMKPTRPETGYGYIQKAKEVEGWEDLYKVKTFTEKPNLELAKVFLESSEFLWNSGIFLWNLRTIAGAIQTYLPELHSAFMTAPEKMGTEEEDAYIQEIFPVCPNISIDYGVMEKAASVHVQQADFGWSDLGTWGSLYDLSAKDEKQNATLKCKAEYYDSEGNVVVLPEGHLAVLQGMKDMIVVESDNVLLICPKQEEQQIRQIVMDVEHTYSGKFN
ncbi:MAG: mannose-1-phosphate guanylyltransferase [Paludibacteraceae bacterium]|nr:mannose-1-phosphate guanylyltransferase [Paludibacteraceae bacterium]